MATFVFDVLKKNFAWESSPTQRLATPEQAKPQQAVHSRSDSIRQNTAPVLILGRSGSGKTSFVDAACLGAEQTAGKPSNRTIKVVSSSVVISNQTLELIDTPGFDNIGASDVEVLVELASYLWDKKRAKVGVAGVVYIHRAGDPLSSKILAQNIKVLSEVILGETGLSRLTVLVVPANSGPLHSASVAQMVAHASSALHPLFPTRDHRILVSNFDQSDITNILTAYIDKEPVVLRIQQDSLQAPQILQVNILASVEARLGYCEHGSVRAQLQQQEKRYKTHYENKIAGLQALLHEAQSSVSQYADALKQTEQQLKGHRDEIVAVRCQLQQTQSEYASLRSQLQLQENIEQSEIVQGLKDLNRDIDDIGRSISEHLVDNHGQATFDKDPADLTTQDARHLHDLKMMLGHMDGHSSLISCASGIDMAAEDFFDYSIRSLLCLYLCEQVFSPFHPGVDPSQSNFINAMYADVQQREPQAVAAKWRVDSFKSIYKPNTPNAISQHVDRIAQAFIQHRLGPLITNFFGRDTEVVMIPRHYEHLQRLVQTAWDWSTKLKEEVVMLGDFHLTAYPPSSVFDPAFMSEFEPNPRQPPVTSILGTLGLGLVSLRAIGGSRPPEITVVYKALVATQSLYA
ncbi:hypothetical protein BDV93DRAFT_516062 [Ceratobasidium sp. AG-I]|nr:hypothetical protein BDV93DRAFT_516062 [Ceratobasidium sp. AG-I]